MGLLERGLIESGAKKSFNGKYKELLSGSVPNNDIYRTDCCKINLKLGSYVESLR